MKQPEYTEGPEALENFENGMKALFNVPKDAVPAKKKARKKKRANQTSESGPSRDSGGEA